MDLRSLYTSGADGAALHLKNPVSGAPLYVPSPSPPGEESTDPGRPIMMQVVCKDSDRFRHLAHSMADKRIAAAQATEPGQPPKQRSSAEIEADNVKLVAHCIIGWDNIILDGIELPYSPENARKLLAEFPAFYEQVNDFAAIRGNFVKASS